MIQHHILGIALSAGGLAWFVLAHLKSWHMERRIQQLEHEVASMHAGIDRAGLHTDIADPQTPEVARRFADMVAATKAAIMSEFADNNPWITFFIIVVMGIVNVVDSICSRPTQMPLTRASGAKDSRTQQGRSDHPT